MKAVRSIDVYRPNSMNLTDHFVTFSAGRRPSHGKLGSHPRGRACPALEPSNTSPPTLPLHAALISIVCHGKSLSVIMPPIMSLVLSLKSTADNLFLTSSIYYKSYLAVLVICLRFSTLLEYWQPTSHELSYSLQQCFHRSYGFVIFHLLLHNT